MGVVNPNPARAVRGDGSVFVRIRSVGIAGCLDLSPKCDVVDAEVGDEIVCSGGCDSKALEMDRSARALGDEAERAKKDDWARVGLVLVEDEDVPAIERCPLRFVVEGGRNRERRKVIVD